MGKDLKVRERLVYLTESAREIVDATSLLVCRLERLDSKLRKPHLGIKGDQVDPLLLLNRRLAEIEHLLDQVKQDVQPELLSKVADEGDPMSDFELEAKINYVLKESDPDWDDDSDNILTSRRNGITFGKGVEKMSSERDFCEHMPGLEPISVEPHCYLFHDLYDHSYGMAEQRLSFEECARVGEIWIDVVIRQQYFMNVETGEWSCAAPQPFMERLARGKSESC